MEPVNLGTHKFNHLLDADDLILISEKSSGLQYCLNALEVYCEEWGLNINTKKIQIMIFKKNQRLSRACIVHLVIKKPNWSYVKTMSCVILELRST